MSLYDKNLRLKLACDASAYGGGVGAVLYFLINRKNDIYESTTLNIHERNYSRLDKEGVAIMHGSRKFSQYIYGRKFKLCTDNKTLIALYF